MLSTPHISIPLLARDGSVRAHALVDEQDAHLADHRWCRAGRGYVCRQLPCVDGKRGPTVYLHRVVLGLSPGDGLEADHINGDLLDNRRANLRVVTHGENCHNRPSQRGTSRYRGVSWNKRRRKWVAHVKLNRQQNLIGFFDDEEEAAVAARAFRSRHMTHAVADRM